MSTETLNILKIDSSSRHEGSVSRQLSSEVVQKLTAAHSSANVVERDATQGLAPIGEDWIGANFTPADSRSDSQKQALSLSDSLVAELHAADVLVIGVPIYNFGVPAALKAWIDLIARAGETFQYGENGPVGLLTGKRAIVTVASGGVPVGSPMDHATTYLTQVLGFVGISDVTYISATGLAMDPEAPLLAARDQIDQLDTRTAA